MSTDTTPNYEFTNDHPLASGDIEFLITDKQKEGPDIKVLLAQKDAADPTNGENNRELMKYFSKEIASIINTWPTTISLTLESADIMKEIIKTAKDVPDEVVQRLDDHSEKLFAFLQEASNKLMEDSK